MKILKQMVGVLLISLLMMVSFSITGTRSADFSGAKLVGVKYDCGLDTDDDGTFNYLIVGVEISVSNASYYEVYVSGLTDSYLNYIDVYGYNYTYVGAGSQVLNVSLNGETIYESGRNPRYVAYIELWGDGYLENVPLTRQYSYTEFDQPHAKLTGEISDKGVDTDGDDAFNYLEIGVQVNVTKAGNFSVYVNGLQDSTGKWISVYNREKGYLNVGLGYLNVYLSGYRIRSSRINPSYVGYVSLSNGCSSYQSYLNLSREYLYTEFDAPAVLTGVISEQGKDTDGDGDFNFLEIGVQVDVADPGEYEMQISGLLDADLSFIDVSAYQSVYLEAGLHFVNFTLDGTRIYLSHRNPRYINAISFWFWGKSRDESYYEELRQVPLSRQYTYDEFDPPGAMLTGKISDRGVDTDSDGSFDFLEIGVELKVMETGNYFVSISELVCTDPNETRPYYIYVGDYKTVNLNVGVQTVNFYLYGPDIYVSHHNPANVSYISVSDSFGHSQSLSDIPLSKVYSYTQFDAPFTDVETKFIVYPDGRVALEGSLKHTHMTPKNRGPTAQGSFNLTPTQASAGLTLTFPSELASQFPLNSTTADLLATYSNGLLNMGINSTMILPPGDQRQYPFGQYPFNATDGTVKATYSGGNLNIEAEGKTTLPPLISNQFPFNSTDVTVVGAYSPNTLDGTITFSVLDKFTFDDVNVDFTGTPTDFTLNGTVHVVFNVPLGNFIIHNETELIQIIDQLKSLLPGEKGIVWNMTGGLLNVTTLDIDYELTNGMVPGAKVTFKMVVHGDFVQALAYVMSGGRNQMLLYPVLNEVYQSVQSGSFDIKYSHKTLEASVKLTFSYDLKSLIDYVLTPPAGTTPYIMTDYDMSPTIYLGDVVFVEAVSNAGDISADPNAGDIIAFKNPSDSKHIVIRRAINKTQVSGTWYFQTKGDAYYTPDYWTGNNTYNGMISESYLIGKASSRIPLLGYVLAYPYSPYYYGYYYPDIQSTVAPGMSLLKAVFSSLESMSLKLSYSSMEKRFDFSFSMVDKLKALADEIALILPETLPPETPAELKLFVESLLKTKYASVSSAQVSLSYENGKADFKATATIEGDLNAELNYVKNLLFGVTTYVGDPNATTPWQLAFINQTKIDVSNFKLSAKLSETSFEGQIQGVTITPPRNVTDATFNLTGLFSLTASPYEFPTHDQRLRITIEGGSNATHTVTLFRPTSVPEPNETAPYEKSMVWFNQTLSSLKDLVFKIQPIGEVSTISINVDPASVTVGSTVTISGTITPMRPNVDVTIYYRPTGETTWVILATVKTDAESKYSHDWAPSETGTYELKASWAGDVNTLGDESDEKTLTVQAAPIITITGTLRITTTPVVGEVFVNGESWGLAPQSRDNVQIGTYTVSFGEVNGYYTPTSQVVNILEKKETTVEGIYEPITGTLSVTTTPVTGEVFVNGVSWGLAAQSRIVQIGTYTVSFGNVENFNTPVNQVAIVKENLKTTIEGVYQPKPSVTVAQITNPELVSATNPFTVDAIEDAATSLIISEISDPITIIVRNITVPTDAPPLPGTWMVLGNCVQIIVNNTDITVNATIRIYYTLEQLEASGLDENTLKIHYWNTTSNQWVQVESHVNKDEHYVWAIIDHFSLFAILGQPTEGAPLLTPLWLTAIAIVVIIAVTIVSVIYIRKRKTAITQSNQRP